MSWLFSQALVAEYLGESSSDGEQSVQLNGNPTQLAYLPPDRMTAFSRLSRFGMTFKPLTESRGEELLTWYREAFLARTLVQRGGGQELKEADQVCGSTWHELSMKYDLDTHSWRTHQCLWDEALQWSSVTLPKWGMTVNGVLFQHPTAERPINGTGSGFWPTPTAHNAKETNAPSEANRNEPTLASRVGGHLNPMWVEKLMGWPEDWSSIKPISHIKMLFWLMGFEHDAERCVNQILRMLQKGNVQEEIREATGRFFGISEAAVLLAQLCEYTDRPYEAWVFMESKKAFEKQMRGLRVSEETSSPSCRPEQQEQRAGEYSDALQALSRLLAHYGKEAWQDGSWEDAVPRVESNVSARVDRLKAIGNGQVPVVAATAFRILSGATVK